LFAAAFLLRFWQNVTIFKAENAVHENRLLAVRNAEARGSIPLCSTNNFLVFNQLQLRQNLAEILLGVTLT